MHTRFPARSSTSRTPELTGTSTRAVATMYVEENSTVRCRSQVTEKLLTTRSTWPRSTAAARSAMSSTTYCTRPGSPKIAVGDLADDVDVGALELAGDRVAVADEVLALVDARDQPSAGGDLRHRRARGHRAGRGQRVVRAQALPHVGAGAGRRGGRRGGRGGGGAAASPPPGSSRLPRPIAAATPR